MAGLLRALLVIKGFFGVSKLTVSESVQLLHQSLICSQTSFQGSRPRRPLILKNSFVLTGFNCAKTFHQKKRKTLKS